MSYFAAFHIVEVEVLPAVLLTGPDELLAVFQKNNIIVELLRDIVFVFFIQQPLGFTGERISQQQLQFVLVAVEAVNTELLRTRPLDAGNVNILFIAQVDPHRFAVAQAVHINMHLRVGFSHFGVFEGNVLRIELIVVVRHCKLLHLAFIKAIKGNVLSIRRPEKGFGEGEFFLVHPVGSTIDDLIVLTILGDLARNAGGQVFDVEVVVMHKCHLIGLRVESGVHLLASGIYRG